MLNKEQRINKTIKLYPLYSAFIGDLIFFVPIDTLYLTLEAIEEILKEYSKKYISTLNVEKIRKERVKLFPYELPETRDLAIKFIDSKKNNYIKTHGEDTANFTRLINAIEAFIVNLDKEVFNCTSDDILNIISDKEKIKTGYLPNVCQFLNYIKS